MKTIPRLFLLAVLTVPASAQRPAAWGWQFTGRYSASGTKSLEEGGNDRGAFRSDGVEYGARRRVLSSGQFNLTLGAAFERVSLRHSPLAPLPDHLQSASGVATAGFVFQRKAWATLTLAPGFYGTDELTANDFNMPGVAAFHYLYRPNLHLIGGLAVDATRKAPVLPFAGALWRLNEKWNLRLTLPNARVEYRAYWTPKATVDLFTGLSFSGGQYRVSKDLGRRRGRPDIGGQILSYSSQQVVAGASAAGGGVEAELYGGWAYSRRLEYSRPGYTFKSDGAPTIGVSLTARL